MLAVMSYVRCLMLLAVTSCCYASPIGVDGILGPEWAGITPTFVPFIAGSPEGNFGGLTPPTGGTDAVGYNIYLRSDGTYVYGFFQTLPLLGGVAVANFANLYFATNPSVASSTLGFELSADVGSIRGNRNAFIPGGAGSFDASPFLTVATTTGTPPVPDTLEFALPVSFFTTDPLAMGFPKATEGRIVLRLSQSFGFSVAGGPTFGPDVLGSVSLPEPSTLPLLALGLSALVGIRRRRK